MPEMQNVRLNSAVNSQARKLWFAAKRNFYYRDDPFRAALLCRQIIAQPEWSEEADEAKLLLHDIGFELRKLSRGVEKKRVRPAAFAPREPHPPENTSATGLKIAIATAVVALPIIGIARDGIVGIALPEAAALMILGSLFRLFSRIRPFVKGH